jgi:hypothetical protein
VPSTLNIDAFNNATYTAGTGVANNLTLSDGKAPGSSLIEHVFTDSAEKINVTGPGAVHCTGSGTNQVVCDGSVNFTHISIDVVDGNDTVNVQSIDNFTTVAHSGLGDLTVNVGNAQAGVQQIVAPLTIHASAFSTTNIKVDNSADTGAHSNVTLSDTKILNLAPSVITYVQTNGSLNVTVDGGSAVSSVYPTDTYTVTNTPTNNFIERGSMTLNTGIGSNLVNVEGTSGPLTIQGHGGRDLVQIGSNPWPGSGGTVLNVQGAVGVNNTTATTRLLVDDSGETSSLTKTLSLSDTTLLGLAPAAITYQPSALDELSVGIGNFANTFTVTDTPPSTTIGLGAGPNRLQVEGLTGQLNVVPTNGRGLTGQTTAVVGSNPSGAGGTLANIHGEVFFQYLAGPSISLPSTVTVDDTGDATSRTVQLTASGTTYAGNTGKITGLAPGADVAFSALAGNVQLVVNGGSGGNTFNVANVEFPLLSTTINGGKGNDTFNVSNSNSSLTINTGTGTNHVNVQGLCVTTSFSFPLNVVGHGGTDTVTVGSLAPVLGGTLGNIFGTVNVSNSTWSTALIIDDSGDSAARAVTVGASAVQFAGIGGPINYLAGVKSVDVEGGGNDTFTDQASSWGPPVTIHGGSGINTLIGGGGGNLWTLSGTNSGTLHNVTFQNIQNLRSGFLAQNTFFFKDQASISGSIVVGPGSSGTLDYSPYTTPVTVNLLLNQATGVGGIVTGINNVFGGSGNNILVGNGNNTLRGGSGRDILISGGGTSTLQAGSGEAILLGAHCVFAGNPTALSALMAEWSRPIPYAQRVQDLMFGGGLNGPFVLNSSTVSPDPGVQSLTSGAGLDLLFYDLADVLTHPLRYTAGEVAVLV